MAKLKLLLIIFVALLCFVSIASANPSITYWSNNETDDSTLNITLDANQNTSFNVTANQSIITWDWYADDMNKSHNFDNISLYWITTGNKTLSVNATNVNGTSNTITWNITVEPDENYMSPLYVSPNGRYLMDENNTPFMYISETMWHMPQSASRENITWVYEQLNNDTLGGATAVKITILMRTSDGSGPENPIDYYGHQAFNGGTVPDFNSPKEVAGDNNDYWDTVDYIVEEAKNHSLYLMICPIWANYYFNGHDGTTIINESALRTHSEWFSDRYKDENHLLWMIGGDGYDPPVYGTDHMYFAQAEALVKGKTGCTDCPTHNETSSLWTQVLMNHHSHPDNFSSDWYGINESWMQIDGAYAGKNFEIWPAYNLENPRPIIETEGYGFWSMTETQTQRARSHQYHHYLAGGRGFEHMNEYVWDFTGDWETRLTVPERVQFTIMKSTFESIAWYNLIPDQSIILSDNSYSELDFLNVTMASTSSDENLIMVYFSPFSTKEAQIDLSNITTHTHANATWINPINNTTQTDTTYLVSNDPTYTVPSGWEDGILLLEGYDAPLGTWNYYKEITINHSMVSENLVNFSVLINTTDTDLRDHAQSDGDDIIFRDSDQVTQLDHEQEDYNSTTGEYCVWVRVPVLNGTVNTTIYMYYNNSLAVNSENSEGVWDSNYLIVQHLSESPDNSAGQIVDSSSNNNDGTTANMDSTNQVDGQINGSFNFDGSTESVEFTDIDGSSAMPAITASTWVSLDAKTDFDTISEKSAPSNVNPVYRIFLDDSADQKWRWKVWGADGVTAGNIYSDSAADTGNWVYVVGRYNGSEVCMFINGVKQSVTLSETGVLRDVTNNARIGSGNTQYLDGKMDEYRVSKSARSDGWILTKYNNVKYPDLFINVGAEQGEEEYIPPDPTSLANTTGDFWVHYTWDAGSGNITDLYNVSYNGTWDNTSSNTYRNESTDAHGHLEIVVYAYNSSGSGTLSTGYITDNVTIPNNVPVLSDVSSSYGLYENATFVLDANHTDDDGDTITYSDNSSDWDINTATGEVSWELDYNDVGIHPYRITIDDGHGGTDYQDFTVTINGIQNTALTSVDTTFENGIPGTDFAENTITLSFYLVNSGSIDADVSAKFTSNYDSTYGLVSGTSTIGGSNFKLGNSTLDTLLDTDTSVDLTDAVPGQDTQRNYEVQLRVPAGQSALSYSGTIELTFSDIS